MSICSNQIENCEHFFFHCSLYTMQRRDLLSQPRLFSNGLAITTDLLLFGSDQLSTENNKLMFQLVETYIGDSGRF